MCQKWGGWAISFKWEMSLKRKECLLLTKYLPQTSFKIALFFQKGILPGFAQWVLVFSCHSLDYHFNSSCPVPCQSLKKRLRNNGLLVKGTIETEIFIEMLIYFTSFLGLVNCYTLIYDFFINLHTKHTKDDA